jgi:hypothetical protein
MRGVIPLQQLVHRMHLPSPYNFRPTLLRPLHQLKSRTPSRSASLLQSKANLLSPIIYLATMDRRHLYRRQPRYHLLIYSTNQTAPQGLHPLLRRLYSANPSKRRAQRQEQLQLLLRLPRHRQIYSPTPMDSLESHLLPRPKRPPPQHCSLHHSVFNLVALVARLR